MKSYVVKKGSTDLSGLKLVNQPKPTPSDTQILVKMRAASLNYRDQLVISGNYFGGSVQRDTIPLSDGAGEVVAVGSKVTRFKKGDRVAGTFFRNWNDGEPRMAGPQRQALGSPADGVLTEFAAFDENDAVLIPKTLSFEEASCLPCAGVTAWSALMVTGKKLVPGNSVLVLGTGGVSVFGLLFGKATGCTVIATSSSDQKLKKAKALGADHLINYKKTPDWEKEVMAATGGLGADCIVEVGGLRTLTKSMQCVGMTGKICIIGFLAGFTEGGVNPIMLAGRYAAIHGIGVGSRRMFEDMNAAIEANGLKPPIDKVFPFDKAVDAIKHAQSQKFFGKIVIKIA
jgi:NADPH:quinone reductase-like Zn-dependent oxidoreductase